ncbi:MAG TPA: hypothetical protein VES42_11590, partial [Pilimelia sp.]|nr:hypothetical protein [Pilimelia sp.]
AHCVRLVPAAVRRTFTIRQFTRLVTAAGPVDPPVDAAAGPRLRALVGAAIAARPRVQAVPGAADDLPDPVNGPLAGFRTCAKELWASMGVMTAPLACQPTGGSPPR